MTENSYHGEEVEEREPSVFDAKIAILLGPTEQKTILIERPVAGEIIVSAPDGGVAQVSINDSIDLLLEAVVAMGETVSDQIGAPYTQAMPSFLAEFAAALLDTPYDRDDDNRQAHNRLLLGLPPLASLSGE